MARKTPTRLGSLIQDELQSKKSLKSKLAQNDQNVEFQKHDLKVKQKKRSERIHKLRKDCMIYPESSFKNNWDLLISLILIFTSLVFPVRIAFVEEDDQTWQNINLAIDLLFLSDIILNFNSAYYDEDY